VRGAVTRLREIFDEADKVMTERQERIDAFYTHMIELYHRQNYREESEHAEFVDLGGES
jgi:hypothetical protein